MLSGKERREFKNRATWRSGHLTTFNLKLSDFQTLKYKEVIQEIFSEHFFPDVDITDLAANGFDMNRINKSIKILKNSNMQLFEYLHKYGKNYEFGPGEVTLFCLINDATLGGGSVSVDLTTQTGKYEVKGSQISRNGYAYDFKTGGTFSVDEVKNALVDLNKKHGLGGSAASMASSILDTLKKLEPAAYAEIEKRYAELTYDNYFSKHKVIFVNNNESNATRGLVEAFKYVDKKDISIERITSNVIKPKVLLK